MAREMIEILIASFVCALFSCVWVDFLTELREERFIIRVLCDLLVFVFFFSIAFIAFYYN